MTSLNSEHHIHLYGCIDAKDLWEIGKTKYKENTERLNWYADEYEKAYGKRPNWKDYWETDDGLKKLTHDFLFLDREPFPKFQAKFNLIIALCKINPNDTSIVERVFLNLKNQGISYAEARAILPPYIQGDDVPLYFTNIAKCLIKLEKENPGFIPRMAISLPRESPFTQQVYQSLRKWMDENPQLAHTFSAVDLAFYEENDPPKNKKDFVNTVLNDNKNRKNKLAFLYHVGESFNTISAASSARWVWEVAHMGATRMGHAISLGIGVEELKGRAVQEKLEERLDHINWLLENQGWLHDEGYQFSEENIKQEKEEIEKNKNKLSAEEFSQKTTLIEYTEEYLADFQKLQTALIQHIKKNTDTVIECCPTSNRRIGMIQNLKNHPLKRFADAGLNICLSTDDPGIFNIDLNHEVNLALNEIGLTPEQLETISKQQTSQRSQQLTQTLTVK